VRANIFVPQGAELVLVYQANMNGDSDERIRFSHGQGITSLVYYLSGRDYSPVGN